MHRFSANLIGKEQRFPATAKGSRLQFPRPIDRDHHKANHLRHRFHRRCTARP